MAPKPSAISVLIVDDEPQIRNLFSLVLVTAGYGVATAQDGDEAIEALGGRSFDLLITDLVMPNREGVETIIAARRLYPALKIIAVSGAIGDEFLKALRRLGANASILKPVKPEVLVNAVRAVLC